MVTGARGRPRTSDGGVVMVKVISGSGCCSQEMAQIHLEQSCWTGRLLAAGAAWVG